MKVLCKQLGLQRFEYYPHFIISEDINSQMLMLVTYRKKS